MSFLRNLSMTAAAVALAATGAATVGLTSGAALAQGKGPALKLGVVNMVTLQRKAKAWGNVREQSTKLVKRFRGEAVKEQKRLRKAYANLERQCAVRSIQWCRRARIRLNQQAQEFQRLTQIRRQQLGRSLQKAQNAILVETRRVVKAISVERGFTLVMTSNGVIHYAPGYDITDEVVKRLNKALPKLKLEFPVKGTAKRKATPKKKPGQ